MTIEGHAAAMSRPIHCTGHGDCRQGRSPCRTPLTCSGMPADEAIDQLRGRLHREPMPDLPITMDAAEDIGKPYPLAYGLLVIGTVLVFSLGYIAGRV